MGLNVSACGMGQLIEDVWALEGRKTRLLQAGDVNGHFGIGSARYSQRIDVSKGYEQTLPPLPRQQMLQLHREGVPLILPCVRLCQ